MVHAHVKSGGRYPVLRSVAILLVFNVIPLLGTGGYWLYYLLSQPGTGTTDRLELAALVIAATFFAILISIGLAEMIKLFMDIEQNTRAARGTADTEETAEGALFRGH